MKSNKINKTKKNSGFTLFELLVSISIIAVLTAVAVVSFGGLNKKTRDARRSADLEKVRMALEASRQIGTTYPSNLDGLITSNFLDKLPTDPKTKVVYPYVRDTTNYYTYQIGTSMEDLGSTNTSAINVGGISCNYILVNP